MGRSYDRVMLFACSLCWGTPADGTSSDTADSQQNMGTVGNTGDVTAAVGQREGEATRTKDILPFPSLEYTLLF